MRDRAYGDGAAADTSSAEVERAYAAVHHAAAVASSGAERDGPPALARGAERDARAHDEREGLGVVPRRRGLDVPDGKVEPRVLVDRDVAARGGAAHARRVGDRHDPRDGAPRRRRRGRRGLAQRAARRRPGVAGGG